MSTMQIIGSALSKAQRPWKAVRAHLLSVGACACFVAAAVMVAIPLGLVVAGLSLLVIELRISGGSE